jgi:phosphoserine phosphatase
MGDGDWRLVTVDLDGTLTLVHGWQVIADRLGRRADFDRAMARYRLGTVGEDEHLRDLLELATGAGWDKVESALTETPRLAAISEGIGLLRSVGVRVALLTHNPPYVGQWYLRRFGFDDLEGSVGPTVEGGRISPPGPVRADKRSGLTELVRRANVRTDQTVHVGDGPADAALFPLVGRGIAVNAARAEVARAADLALRTSDFRDVARAVLSLGPRT